MLTFRTAKLEKGLEVLDVLRIAESYSQLEEFANSLIVCCAAFAHGSTVAELMTLFDEVDVEGSEGPGATVGREI